MGAVIRRVIRMIILSFMLLSWSSVSLWNNNNIRGNGGSGMIFVSADDPCSTCASGSSCTNGTVTICPTGYYCPSCSSAPVTCGTNRTSATGSSSSNDCYCSPGFVGVNGMSGLCTTCTAGSYCSGGNNVTVCPVGYYCPSGSSSPLWCGYFRTSLAGSVSGDACTCIPGYAAANIPNAFCAGCYMGSYCTGGQNRTTCPMNYYCPTASASPRSCGEGSSAPIGNTHSFSLFSYLLTCIHNGVAMTHRFVVNNCMCM
jgi:hypothetical protein